MNSKNLTESIWPSGPDEIFLIPTKTAELRVNGEKIAWTQGDDPEALVDTLYYVSRYIAGPNPAILLTDIRFSNIGSQSLLDI